MMDISHERAASCVGVASLLVAAFLLAGCGDDDGDATGDARGDDTTSTPSAPPPTAGPEPTTAGAPTTTAGGGATTTGDSGEEQGIVDIVLSDYAFGGVPESVPAGTKLQVENISEKEFHELVAMRIPDDEERPVYELVQLPEAEIDALFGDAMPAAVLLAPPGGEQIAAVGDGTLNEPGRYALLCFIPTGADLEEFMKASEGPGDGPPHVDGGPPHVVHGMHAELVVE